MTGTCVTWQRKRKRRSLMVEEEGICVNWCDGSRILRLFEDWSGICNWRLCTAACHWMCSGVYFWNRLYLIFLAGGVKDPGFWDVLKIDRGFRMCTVQWGAFLRQVVSDPPCCCLCSSVRLSEVWRIKCFLLFGRSIVLKYWGSGAQVCLKKWYSITSQVLTKVLQSVEVLPLKYSPCTAHQQWVLAVKGYPWWTLSGSGQ